VNAFTFCCVVARGFTRSEDLVRGVRGCRKQSRSGPNDPRVVVDVDADVRVDKGHAWAYVPLESRSAVQRGGCGGESLKQQRESTFSVSVDCPAYCRTDWRLLAGFCGQDF